MQKNFLAIVIAFTLGITSIASAKTSDSSSSKSSSSSSSSSGRSSMSSGFSKPSSSNSSSSSKKNESYSSNNSSKNSSMSAGFSSSKPSASQTPYSNSKPAPNPSELSRRLDSAQSQKSAINSWDNRNTQKDSSALRNAATAGVLGAAAASTYSSPNSNNTEQRNQKSIDRDYARDAELARLRRQEHESRTSNYNQPTQNGSSGLNDVLTGVMIGRMTAPHNNSSSYSPSNSSSWQSEQRTQPTPIVPNAEKSSTNQSSGFAGGLLIFILFLGCGAVGWFIYKKYRGKKSMSNYNLD